MVLSELPSEVIRQILLYLPISTLKSFCDYEDDSLKNLAHSIIYEKVYFGRSSREGFYSITIPELAELDQGTIQAQIKHFFIRLYGDPDSHKRTEPLTGFLKSRPKFLKGVSRIDLQIRMEDFESFVQYLPMDNIRRLELTDASGITLEMLPPNINELSLSLYGSPSSSISCFPRSLRKLRLSLRLGISFNGYPPWLELLSITAKEFETKNNFPASLRNLEINGTEIMGSIDVPENITSLKFCDCTIQSLSVLIGQLPSGLKCLTIYNSWITDNIGYVLFPPALEVVHLEECLSSTEFENLLFPKQQFLLRNNILQEVPLLSLPNLRILDIRPSEFSHFGLKSISRVQFPRTLEVLLADGHVVEDWSKTALPDTLKSLSITTRERAQDLTFPPSLETLVLIFCFSRLVQYSGLKLPKTLQDLLVRNGVSSEFDWGLPLLRRMSLHEFDGPVLVPKTVEDLTLIFADKYATKQLKLPPYVEKLTLSHPLEVYPASVSELTIYDYRDEKIILPPRLRSLILYSEAEDYPLGELLVLPDSLVRLSHMCDPGPPLPSSFRD